jgi:flagellin
MASFSVVSNIASANAQANLHSTNIGLNKALTRLSSGFRINYAGDDAAGLAVANSYRNELAVLNQGIRNANDGLSQLQIKDGALGNIANLLDRMATLATQASSASNGVDIGTLQDEFNAVLAEIDREAVVAGVDTTAADNFAVFVSNEHDGTTQHGEVKGTIGAADATTLFGAATVTWTTAADAQASLADVEDAISNLGDVQSTIGTLQNRLQFAIGLATSQVVNKQAAESRIRDANIAEESANMTRYNILSQSGIAALAQANQMSSSVLALLR